MRLFYLFVTIAVTVALIVLLDRPIGPAPPIGRFLSPQHGFWQNADPSDLDYSDHLDLDSLNGKVEVYFDERLVPHVFAEQEPDAIFVQGYLHARFRLWQMEFQTHAAAGRLSEVLGAGPDSAFLNNDRYMRRLGMLAGAKESLVAMESDPLTLSLMNAYTAGVNAYIRQLEPRSFPLEYKLLNYQPEPWTNLKTALFLKYMSYDLTGSTSDLEYSNAKSYFSKNDLSKLYPLQADSSSPIVPKGTVFAQAGFKVKTPLTADSLYLHWQDSTGIVAVKPDKDNGSNNWVVAGSKTKSGRPILCNDPHLGLNLPSLWYEMQITTPGFSAYGVSFPGAPAIVIGYNNNIAWGVTNASRDVMDYYSVEFKDETSSAYRFNNVWQPTEKRIDVYHVKDGKDFVDTVVQTIFGPVVYDRRFSGSGRAKNQQPVAVKWKAQEASNELKTFLLLNKAKNYDDYLQAIRHFSCPGQNFAFASKTGDIAIWHQGSFPAKWKYQGDYVMPGFDSSYMWQGNIPQEENPHLLNPSRGFVSSANQQPADSAYPYYLGGDYDVYRGLIINRKLSALHNIVPADMLQLQNDNYNVFAEVAVPILLHHIDKGKLKVEDQKYLGILETWNKKNDSTEAGPVVLNIWYEFLEELIWNDELSRQPAPYKRPEQYTLVDALSKDTSFSFIDDLNTPQKETLTDIVTQAYQKALPIIHSAEAQGKLVWGRYKDSGIRHLLRLAPLSRYHLATGGGLNIINALKQYHGPSWRMVVELKDDIEAYGVYPGGQSGNPGSKFYDVFVDQWTKGQYYKLWMMRKGEERDHRIKFVMQFNKN